MAKGTDASPRRPSREMTGTTTWALSPTDLTFLWDECPRCFYNKVALKRSRPRSPFPKVFGAIDRAMKGYYLGARAQTLVPGMAPGVIVGGDRWVKSAPVVPPGCDSSVCIRGRVDVLIECDDGTTAIVDFKTTEPSTEHVGKYSRQLHAYALALEHPAKGQAVTVSSMGLLCFAPDRFETQRQSAMLSGAVRWTEVPRDDVAFQRFLTDVVSVLDQRGPPAPESTCPWCRTDVSGGWAA
jgi:hypothetical protein